MPFVRAEAADEEEDDADAYVGKDDTHPDFIRQRVHEAKDMRLVVHRPLDHDGDAEAHEGLGEVDHLFTICGDSQRGDNYVCFLKVNETHTKEDRNTTTTSGCHIAGGGNRYTLQMMIFESD